MLNEAEVNIVLSQKVEAFPVALKLGTTGLKQASGPLKLEIFRVPL